MDLRKKQNEIRNEKLRRLQHDIKERGRIDPLEATRERNRLVSTTHDPHSSKVKELISKRVSEYKTNEERWYNSLKEQPKKLKPYSRKEMINLTQ